MSTLLLSVQNATVRFTKTPVFEDLTFNIHQKSRIALVGKNGAGKSTLMNIITGIQELDEGERWENPGLSIGYLHQDITPKSDVSVYDYVLEEIKESERELYAYKVDIIVSALFLDPKSYMSNLSGGQLRRAGLARALVEEPDILLLDEPTNHLDLEIIQWLEGYLKSYNGTLVIVSHDRTFLSEVTNQVFWLDRGELKVSPRGFKFFEEWSSALLEQEERELKRRKQIVNIETEWANRGVKARVKRNVRRLQQAKEMREQLKADEAAYRRATKKIEYTLQKNTDHTSKIVAEFHKVFKSFEEEHKTIKILEQFSCRIQRGDRIGVIGKNGSGKTTFLKMLLKMIEPDQGRVKIKKDLEFSYFDQKRSDLDPNTTLKRALSPGGSDYIDVMGKERHVCGYLKDFMFDPSAAEDKVSTLSGGQKNRLMLAKVLANPKSCLILDEPTNDLDMDTLDMLEEILSSYTGTLLVVSHDRDFLDQMVTKIMAFEGGGEVDIMIGGYSDYIEKKNKVTQAKKLTLTTPSSPSKKAKNEDLKAQKKQLTYKLEYELKQLPSKIKILEERIKSLENTLSNVSFYAEDPDGFHAATKELSSAQSKLGRYESRWLELEMQKEESIK